MFNTFKYYLKQAFSGIFRNKLMVLISLSTIIFSMLLLGLAISFGTNLNYVSEQLEASFEVHAFVDLSYSEEAARALQPEIAALENVKEAVFATKEEALESLESTYDDAAFFSGLDQDNPLHYYYKISLADVDKASSVAQALTKIPGIVMVSNRTDVLNGIISFTGIARNVSILAMLLFAFVAIFIISNTIKLTLMNRKTEIEIMKSVGATGRFIRSPFIIEGTIVGIIGGLIAYIPAFFAYKAFFNWWTGFFGLFNLVGIGVISTILLSVFIF
ncbi:MAG: permease-like cell division protein FtsX, partial [Monoglobales bacterium]